jgi:hypothetical protein
MNDAKQNKPFWNIETVYNADIGTTSITFRDEHYLWEADVRSEGCVHIRRFEDGPEVKDRHNDADYIHICDFDLFISRLQELRQLIAKEFQNDWPR